MFGVEGLVSRVEGPLSSGRVHVEKFERFLAALEARFCSWTFKMSRI